MADLIELNIVVKDNGIKQAVTTVSRLERELTKAVKAFDAGTLSQKRLNEVILSAKKQYKDYAGNAGLAAINVNKFVKEQKAATIATKEAKAAAEADALAKKKQLQNVREMQAALAAQKKAQEDNTASLNRMRAAYDSTFAAEQKTLKLKALLRQEIANGNMTVRQAGAELLKYRQSLIAYNEATMAATKGNNRFGVVTQQAGYQVGDFLVQIQSGTNPLVAFGQQATQLVGILPLLGAGFMGLSAGALVALSAGLGIAIPLVTAIGAAFMRTRGEAEEATPAIERMAAALDELDSFSLSSFRSMKDGLQGVNEAVLVTLDLFEQLSQRQLLVASVEFLAGLDVFEQIQEAEKAITANRGRGRARGGEDPFALGLSIEKAREFRDLLYSISGTTREEMANSFAEVVAQMERGGLLTKETTQIIQQMGQELGLVKALQDGVKESAEATAKATDQQNTAINNTKAKLEDILASLRERQALAQAYLNNGEEGVRQEERLLYRQNLINELLSDRGMLTNEQLGLLLETINETFRLEDAVERAKVQLEQSNAAADNLAESLKEAASAMQQMISFGQNLDTKIAQAAAKVQALQKGTNAANAAMIVGLREEAAQRRLTAAASAVGADQLRAINAEYDAQIDKIDELEGLVEQADALTEAQKGVSKATKAVTDDFDRLRQELEGPLVSAVGSISDAFGNFIARGLTDFKGFVQQILGSFQNMIAQMISMAVRNRIMLSLGIGGVSPAMAAAGQVAGIGGAALPFLGSIGAGAGFAGIAGGTGFLGGAANAISGIAGGGAGFFNVAGNAAMAGGGIGATIGAALPVVAAVAAVFSFFSKKVKELDSGLKISITNMDALVQSFRKLETSRFWGLSKKITTEFDDVSDEISNPIIESVRNIQQTVLDAAAVFGFANESFDNFLYDLKISLKGLSEEDQIRTINEELAKMGDSFASLTGHFKTMNELLAAANQRMELQNRLDQLLGNNAAILARQRQAELAAMHEINRPLAQAIYNLEDAQVAFNAAQVDAQNALANLRTSIDAEKNRLRNSFESVVEGLRKRLDVANQTMSRSKTIYDMLEGALSGRFISSGMSSEFARREGALNFIRAGDFKDEERLKNALDVVAEPSENLFKSFEDYARDFYYTSNAIEDAKKIAQIQLTADEKTVLLLESQITKAEQNLEKQLASLDRQYDMMTQQYNAILGLDTSTKSVASAISALQGSISNLATQSAAAAAAKAAAQTAAAESAGIGGGGGQSQSASAREIVNQLYKSGGYSTQNQDVYQKWVSFAEQYGAQQAVETWTSQGNRGTVSAFAQGGFHTGGMRLVGENGPELEMTGPSRIFSHNQSAGMFRDPELKDAVRSLKEEVAGLRSEQLQIQMDISKYTKRTYDIERKWDVDGIPATRT